MKLDTSPLVPQLFINISSDYLLGKTNKIKYLDKPKEKELIG